jgi:triacylglycerol lipase
MTPTRRTLLCLVLLAGGASSGGPAAAAQLAPPALVPAAAAHSAPRRPAAETREVVVLVHGMGRTPLSMLPLEWALEREGYEVLNWGYSSLCCSIAELSRQLEQELEEAGLEERRIHFVGHSLGNIIVRDLLARGALPGRAGRLVMLAPPNQGSHEANRYAPYLGWLLRPLPELRTDDGSTVRALPPTRGVEVGVVAGRYDGKVALEETYLASPHTRIVVPATHSFLMYREDVRQLVTRFLRHGSFDAVPRPRS